MKYSFGEKLKKLRKEKAITVRELSRKSKIPYDTLISLEGRRNKIPTLTTAITISKFYKISIDDLLKGVTFKD